MVDVEPWIENPWAAGHREPEAAPVRLFFNYQMYRQSDSRLMMVATAEKLLVDTRVAEVGLSAVFPPSSR